MKKDKILHLIAGAIIALAFVLIFQYCQINIFWAMVPVTIIGGAKELIWDKWMEKGCAEGGFLVVMLFLLF